MANQLNEESIFNELEKSSVDPAFERQVLLNENLKHQNEYLKRWVESREKYALKAERIVIKWLLFIMLIIVGQILANLFLNKALLDAQVLIALIAGATVTVVGLFHTVLKGIFPTK